MGAIDEEPSLIQALPENVHREHNNQHVHAHAHRHDHHKHVHRRQLGQLGQLGQALESSAAAVAAGAGITEVIQTVSVVRQIAVDTNGVTLAVSIYTTSTDSSTTADTAKPAVTPDGAVSIASETTSLTTSSTVSPPVTTALPSTLSSSITTASSSDPSFPSLGSLQVANGTAPSNTSFIASTSLSSNRTSIALLTSLSSRTSTSSSFNTDTTTTYSSLFTSSIYDATSSSDPASPTDAAVGGVGGGGSGTTTDPGTAAPSSTSASGANDSTPPPTGVVVGSVFGSLAGVALIAVLILFALRWKRQKQSRLSLGSGRDIAPADGFSGGNAPELPMAQRASTFVIPAFASLTGYKRKSQAPSHTNSSTAGSERGFYRVSGRKLPSVLTSGGDGYGDPLEHHLSGSSFYRDSTSFYGGPGIPQSPSFGPSSPQSDTGGIPIMRSGPARTPITTHNSPVTASPPPPPPLRRPDALGRSHASRDGSRNSRFTEEV